MALRHKFGMSPADWVFTAGTGGEAILQGGVAVTFWNAQTGGTQITDLLTADENMTPISQVISGDGSSIPLGVIPEFWGPEGVTELWADAGGTGRAKMTATDFGDTINQVETNTAQLASLAVTVTGFSTVATTGEYDDLTGAPVLALVATTGSYNDLSNKPPLGLQVVQKLGGSWPVRATSAPDASRMAMWVGPEPAPPAGGSYAQANDLWMVTAG